MTVAELRRRYDAVVYATGADADRALGVPGEELAGSTSATSFVKWYKAHPEAGPFDLTMTRNVVVVGAGTVALDVTRILLKDAGELQEADLAAPVLSMLQATR
ncbi:FAD-dependent oxidoreductase [Nocardioides sp. cx-169]|uniref:FAD-dependent oxidoreductase n=1 Tax=Nocardioides sp. cx-169 TaxID=2899080 RepID=UPI001E5D782E|nr:FAD-dependent oxidoreductase [Nocardioides sp. cx-169]MCD4533053.1 FAD-dependent oxidoreductase [Nocardioides sp. cx-169]